MGRRHRPCRDRDADGRRAQPRRAAGQAHQLQPRGIRRPRCGSGRRRAAAQITGQLRRLGASCDWANERFTMDAGFASAVTKVFVELYKRGLAYRDKRLVNWDPKFQTAISDLEVETRDVQGKFWTLRYPLADGSGAIEVATTRPETMLADMAVAVHPDDERYKALIGKPIKHPITGRLIPIVADEHADPELGSGAVKITPGHDFNDFEVGKRAGFKPADMLNMFEAQANVVQTQDGLIPADADRTDREEARRRGRTARSRGRAGPGRGPRNPDAFRRPFGRGDRAVADRPMVCRRRQARRPRDRGRARARSRSSPRAGRRPGSTGSRTSSPGASRGSCGGVIASRLGMPRTGMFSSRRPRRRRERKRASSR